MKKSNKNITENNKRVYVSGISKSPDKVEFTLLKNQEFIEECEKFLLDLGFKKDDRQIKDFFV